MSEAVMVKTSILDKLNSIQTELKAPKGQFNSFGKYNYRSLEDILEAVKPLLRKYKATLTISDNIEMIGTRYYVKATSTIACAETGESVSQHGWAREDENRKGMDMAQLTGSTSSYARKYSLGGLLAIDDNKDPDYMTQYTTEDSTDEKLVNSDKNEELVALFKDSFSSADDDKKAIIMEFMKKNKLRVDNLIEQETAMLEELKSLL